MIWIEVADLLDYAAAHARPTGIQRMAFEIATALRASGAEVRLLRYQPQGRPFVTVRWEDAAALFAPASGGGRAVIRTGGAPPMRPRGPLHAWLAGVLPTELRLALGRAVRAQIAVERALGEAARAAVRPRRKPLPPGETVTPAPGDVLLCLGSPWEYPDYAERLAEWRARGAGVGVFVHDLIPLRRPEWCYAGTVRDFERFFTTVAPLCDHLFVASDSTARDIGRVAQHRGINLRGAIRKLPIGGGFTSAPAERPAHLPPPGYVLFVSTIEPRKNHALLLRVWQRLLETRDDVPTLVFCGRPGWMVGDFLQQLENCAHLDGRILRIEGASDAELASLYRGALFTLYPSLYEGWGLPVVESLAFGVPCIAARATALPEAGGDLARYFDPDDLHDAVRVIETVLDDPADLAAWRARIATTFRPVPWSATADSLLAALQTEIAP